MGVENDYTQFTPKLEELTLFSFAFTHAFVPLSMIINFHRLVRLQLLGSSGGSQDVFVELAESIEDDDRLRLKHFAVELAGDVLSDEIPPLKLALIRIYRACEPLESFHIRVSHVDIALFDLLLALNIPPHNLQSLSFHTSEWNWGRCNQDAVDMLFRVSQDRFRQVKQLAVYFEEAAMLGGLWGEEGNFAILMVSGSHRIQSRTSFRKKAEHAGVYVDLVHLLCMFRSCCRLQTCSDFPCVKWRWPLSMTADNL